MHALAIAAVTAREGQARAARDERWSGLMAAAQAGDAAAYATLLREIAPFLRAIARRRIADFAEAEDAVQDALLTLHAVRHTYDPTRPLRPWLAAIAERRALDRLRRTLARGARETPLDALPDHASSVAPQAERGLADQDLRDAVAQLPESQRQALRLAKLEELPLAEASRRSGLSVGALKVATHRALRTLRRRLGAPDDEGGRT
jgi:RNA polymerase sigma-70 factor (ECF subfamily)